MNQYEIVEVLEKIESEVNSKPVVVSLEMQCKISEDGKKGHPYPIIKVNINGREQFFFVDVGAKVHEMMGKLLPQAIEKKAVIDAEFKARREQWEKRNSNRGQQDRQPPQAPFNTPRERRPNGRSDKKRGKERDE